MCQTQAARLKAVCLRAGACLSRQPDPYVPIGATCHSDLDYLPNCVRCHTKQAARDAAVVQRRVCDQRLQMHILLGSCYCVDFIVTFIALK